MTTTRSSDAPQVRARRKRSKGMLLAASGLVLALAGSLFVAQPPVGADAAIAGSKALLDVPQGKLTSATPECDENKHCLKYSLKLTDARIFQVQASNPTASVSVHLYDPMGTEVEDISVSAGGSDWMTVNVRADGVARPGDEHRDGAGQPHPGRRLEQAPVLLALRVRDAGHLQACVDVVDDGGVKASRQRGASRRLRVG